jgi:hypothetical protein
MSRNPFGWSYPPGAANDPNAPWNQDDDGITQLQDDIAQRLEAAGIPQAFIDDIVQLIACGEQARQDREDAEVIQQLADRQAEQQADEAELEAMRRDELATRLEDEWIAETEAHRRWTESNK